VRRDEPDLKLTSTVNDDGGAIPELKSSLSTSATLSPRLAASTATPAPVAPPPTIKRSNLVSSSPDDPEALRMVRFCSRDGGSQGGCGLRDSLVEAG